MIIIITSVDVIYPTGTSVDVSVKPPKSVSDFFFSGFRVIGRASVYNLGSIIIQYMGSLIIQYLGSLIIQYLGSLIIQYLGSLIIQYMGSLIIKYEISY
jgi:hypothetical protein